MSAASVNKMPLVCILPSTTTMWHLSVDESAVVGTVGSSPIRATWKHPQGSLTPWAALPLCCGLCRGPWMTPAPLGCGLAAPGNSLRCSPTDKRGFVEGQVSSTEVLTTFVRAKITSLDTPERVVFAWSPSHVWLFCDLMDCSPPGSCRWNFPGKNTGVGCHLLLQGIFLTQGLNPHLLHCRSTESMSWTTASGKRGRFSEDVKGMWVLQVCPGLHQDEPPWAADMPCPRMPPTWPTGSPMLPVPHPHTHSPRGQLSVPAPDGGGSELWEMASEHA